MEEEEEEVEEVVEIDSVVVAADVTVSDVMTEAVPLTLEEFLA